MVKECSNCEYCQWSLLHGTYVCEDEDSLWYGADLVGDDWLGDACTKWESRKKVGQNEEQIK